MIVKIGSFSKRHNSTKQPGSSWGTTLADVELKEDTSLEEPVFRIGFSNWNTAYNYIYVPSWNRYYFVIDVTVRIGRIWEVSCRLDAAATYKADIQAARPFVLYADTNNTEIIDNRLPAKTTAAYQTNYATLSQSLMTGQFKIALTVTGIASTTTFLITPQQLRDILNRNSIDNWLNQLWQDVQDQFDDVTNEQSSQNSEAVRIAAEAMTAQTELNAISLTAQAQALAAQCGINLLTGIGKTAVTAAKEIGKKALISPNVSDNIRSATLLPWDVVGDGSLTEIMLGYYPTGVQALPVYNPIQTDDVYINIPWQATDWRRNAPYHQIYLYLPFVGVVEYSPADLIGETQLHVYFSLNVVTGALSYRVATAESDTTLGMYSASTGVAYPVGCSNINPKDIFSSLAGAAGGIGAAATGNLSGGAMVALSSLSALKNNSSSTAGGGDGSASGLDRRLICHSVFHDTNVPPSNLSSSQGQPVSSEVTLSILSGYVQTQGASIQGANMTDAVRQELNTMCDNGIFLE